MAGVDIRGLDIGMLRAFDALMRERSVSRAAARLFLSQPAVSASLNRLRKASYVQSAAFRGRVNGCPMREPHTMVER